MRKPRRSGATSIHFKARHEIMKCERRNPHIGGSEFRIEHNRATGVLEGEQGG
jgi:hypothetical protein